MHITLLWLINEDGEILLAQRAASISSDAGLWGPSVSGGVEPEEAPIEAAIREAEEELGIHTYVLKPVHLQEEVSYSHSDGERREFSVFYAQIPSGSRQHFKLEPAEVAATKWITIDEVQRMLKDMPETLVLSTDIDLWNRLLNQLRPYCVKRP